MKALRILIADDHEVVRRGVRVLLEGEAGWQVCAEAVNGRDAVEAAKREQPHVAVLDIGMPGLDGYEVCRRIRQMPSQQHVVLVAVTGWGQAQDKRRAIEAGFDAHLTKPVDPDAVAQLLAGAAV